MTYTCVTYAHDSDANRILDIIDVVGVEHAIYDLAQGDYGPENDGAALFLEHTYGHLPVYSDDRTAEYGGYTLVYNYTAPSVALYRPTGVWPSIDVLDLPDVTA